MGFFTRLRRSRWRSRPDSEEVTAPESDTSKPNSDDALFEGDSDVPNASSQVSAEPSPLQTNEGRLKREHEVIDSMLAPICIVDRSGTITAVNKAWNRFARENGYRLDISSDPDPDFGIGRNYIDVCADAYGEDVATATAAANGLQEILDGSRERFTMEYPCHSPNAPRWYQLTISAMDPDVGGAIIAHFNITENFELRQANEILDAFAQSLVLAFRTPLGNMRASLDALTSHTLPPELSSNLEQLDESAARLDSMVRDLLAYSRINRSSVVLHPTDLQHSITEALHRLSLEIRRKKAVISVADSFPNIMADPVLLTEAIACLVSNALKFTTPDIAPKIQIYSESGPDAVWLWIEDQGIGVDARDLASIFTIFGRAEGSTIYPGNGIGLAIVYRCMKHMGGAVEVLPHEGGGSRFKLTFPKRTRWPRRESGI